MDIERGLRFNPISSSHQHINKLIQVEQSIDSKLQKSRCDKYKWTSALSGGTAIAISLICLSIYFVSSKRLNLFKHTCRDFEFNECENVRIFSNKPIKSTNCSEPDIFYGCKAKSEVEISLIVLYIGLSLTLLGFVSSFFEKKQCIKAPLLTPEEITRVNEVIDDDVRVVGTFDALDMIKDKKALLLSEYKKSRDTGFYLFKAIKDKNLERLKDKNIQHILFEYLDCPELSSELPSLK